jgi:hypothetical protein
MAISHKKNFGVYHWDTFDNETILIADLQTLNRCLKFIDKKYKGRISKEGADRVDVVDRQGTVVRSFSVK